MSPTLGGKLTFLCAPAQRGNQNLTFLRHLPSKSAIFDLALSLQRCCKLGKSHSHARRECFFFDTLAQRGSAKIAFCYTSAARVANSKQHFYCRGVAKNAISIPALGEDGIFFELPPSVGAQIPIFATPLQRECLFFAPFLNFLLGPSV